MAQLEELWTVTPVGTVTPDKLNVELTKLPFKVTREIPPNFKGEDSVDVTTDMKIRDDHLHMKKVKVAMIPGKNIGVILKEWEDKSIKVKNC